MAHLSLTLQRKWPHRVVKIEALLNSRIHRNCVNRNCAKPLIWFRSLWRMVRTGGESWRFQISIWNMLRFLKSKICFFCSFKKMGENLLIGNLATALPKITSTGLNFSYKKRVDCRASWVARRGCKGIKVGQRSEKHSHFVFSYPLKIGE